MALRTHGTKFDNEKLRMELISPRSLEELADILTLGAVKYSDRNWELGIKYSKVYGATLRHLTAWWKGEDLDQETGKSHIFHTHCNTHFLTHYIASGDKYKEFDDRPK